MKTEIMIDLETLGVPESLPAGALVEVVEIGAVRFGPDGIEDELHVFPAEGNGLCSADTVGWWMKATHKPGWLLERDGQVELPDMEACLKALTAFIGYEKLNIWSKGGFDLDILWGHYSARRLVCPWKYFQRRELRSVMKECGVHQPYETVAHGALADSVKQVELLRECRAKVMVVG